MPFMQQIQQRPPTAYDQGSALLDPAGPFGMEQAMAAQQQEGTVQEQDNTKKMVDMLKQEKDNISNSNKVKQLALKLKEEMQKSQELSYDMSENPEARDIAIKVLAKARSEQK